jgi:hypothetical protein
MSDTVAVVCAECGATLLRHPAMRRRRVVCFECHKRKKNESSKRRRAAHKRDLARSGGNNASGHTSS